MCAAPNSHFLALATSRTQAAAEKHGALGLSGARGKRAAAASKREAARAAARDEAKARLDALLASHGVAHGSDAWRALGQSARDVDAFLEGRAAQKQPKENAKNAPLPLGKKRKLRPWGDPGAGGALKSADDAEGTRGAFIAACACVREWWLTVADDANGCAHPLCRCSCGG
jgi:hypothetical protein